MLAIAVASLTSFAWSFVLAALVLRMKHWRNGVLLARGQPGYKDCVFPRPLWFLGTFLGVATIIPVGLLVSTSLSTMAIASIAPPTTLALVPVLAIISQARR